MPSRSLATGIPETAVSDTYSSFEVETEFLAQYRVQTAGARVHREYWIPAEDMAEFNRHIVGPIEVISEFHSG